MVPGVICNYNRWVAKKCRFQSYLIAKAFENKIFLATTHSLLLKVLRFCQVAREGKVDQLQSLVELENLENIRTWVNR